MVDKNETQLTERTAKKYKAMQIVGNIWAVVVLFIWVLLGATIRW